MVRTPIFAEVQPALPPMWLRARDAEALADERRHAALLRAREALVRAFEQRVKP